MHFTKFTLSIISAGFLAACSTTTPTTPAVPTLPDVPSVGAAANATGTYTIVTNGVTHTMTGAVSPHAPTNTLSWLNGGGAGTMKGSGFETADVLALSAMNTTGANETFAGITGTLGTVPTGGTATYTGTIGFQLLEPANAADPVGKYFGLTLNVNVDFDTSTLSGTGNFSSSLQGDIVGNEFTGTVSATGTVNGAATTVPMQGGFYGANGGTIAGAFAGTGLSGVFSGTVVP